MKADTNLFKVPFNHLLNFVLSCHYEGHPLKKGKLSYYEDHEEVKYIIEIVFKK